MKHRYILILVLFGGVCLGLSSYTFGDDRNLGQIFYDKAVSEYLGGSRDEAIISMEKSLKYLPDNDNAKKILARLLVQRSSDYFYTGEIEKSFIDIKNAKKLLPDDKQVDRLYLFVKAAFEERYRPDSKLQGAAEQKELVQFMAGAYLENKSPVDTGAKAGLSRAEITGLITAFGVGILLLFFAVLRGFDKLAEARERDIYSQRVELERVKWALSEGKNKMPETAKDPAYAASLISAGLSKAPEEMERLLKNPYSAVRAKGLIILEAEMFGNDGQKKAAIRLLDPLISDKDALVSANAARALCRFNFNKGIAVLEKMASGDRQHRVAAMYVLGWLPSEKAVNILLKAVSDSDGKIAAAALKSLTRIKNARYSGVSSKTAAKAENILSLVVIKK
ncbi:MAG: HEAT repeat domain-containing protein [Candidatus Goldbacteria bacterium]|nr:HEAT repeat domain-containing protein [Candidatus Goldiibacteriota bacterium]